MGKCILVTGATKGIGRAICLRFAKEGFDIITCARNADDLQTFKKELQAINSVVRVLTVQADLSKKEEVMNLAQKANEFSKVDVLVNNTGVFLPGAIHEEPEEKAILNS